MSCCTSLLLLNYVAPTVYLGWGQGISLPEVKPIPTGLGKCSKTRTVAVCLTCLLRLPGDYEVTHGRTWCSIKVFLYYSMNLLHYKVFSPVSSTSSSERYVIGNGCDRRDTSPNAKNVYIEVVRFWMLFSCFCCLHAFYLFHSWLEWSEINKKYFWKQERASGLQTPLIRLDTFNKVFLNLQPSIYASVLVCKFYIHILPSLIISKLTVPLGWSFSFSWEIVPCFKCVVPYFK